MIIKKKIKNKGEQSKMNKIKKKIKNIKYLILK